MLNRLSFNQRRPVLNQVNSENNQKENNQKYLNKIKKHPIIDSNLPLKPSDTINYSTNLNTKVTIHPNYSSLQPIEFNTKKTSRIPQKQKTDPSLKSIKSNTQQFCDLYAQEILTSHELTPTFKSDFLQTHQITSALRARMLDWMVEVTKSYKFINKTYFSSVQLMDRYFTETDKKVPVSQLHILGVTTMLIASKMEEVYPLKHTTVYQKIVHKKITKQELIKMQMQVFNTLNHKVNSWSIFDLALFKVNNQIQIFDEETKQKLEEVMSFISKCIMYNYELYIKFDMNSIACVISKISSKICRLPLQEEFNCKKQCYDAITSSLKHFRTMFKGLNNIFKFTDESIVRLIESSLSIEKKN